MRNRVARVARTTIATSKPKSSDMVADIGGTILSTLYGARHLVCRGAFSPPGPTKSAGACRPGFPALHAYLCCYCTTLFLDRATGRNALGLAESIPCSPGRVMQALLCSHALYT